MTDPDLIEELRQQSAQLATRVVQLSQENNQFEEVLHGLADQCQMWSNRAIAAERKMIDMQLEHEKVCPHFHVEYQAMKKLLSEAQDKWAIRRREAEARGMERAAKIAAHYFHSAVTLQTHPDELCWAYLKNIASEIRADAAKDTAT